MQPELDVCLDCLDGAKGKTALLVACAKRKLSVVTCGGAAGKLDPTKIVAEDLAHVSEDRMLALVRKN
jgi:tRNA A37 threonylcarbamoyladenosine dehydratase